MFDWELLHRTFEVTTFVGVMMILVEYLNVVTGGAWQRKFVASPHRQLGAAVLLGALPGCLGAYAVVTLYTHRIVSLGALTACMVATSGDEAFIMLAMFPRRALLLTAALAAIGFLTGVVVDRVTPPAERREFHPLVLHDEDVRGFFSLERIVGRWRQLSLARGVLLVAHGFFVGLLLAGELGHADWDWVRASLVLVGLIGLFISATVPEHFLQKHLWEHTVLQHVPRIFLWTLGTLFAVAAVQQLVDVQAVLERGRWGVLAAAGMMGVLPESGPHLLFVSLFQQGLIPVAVLLANSIVQDGHGMLPLLAQSRKDFVKVKLINLLVGLLVGALLMLVP